MYTHTHTHTQTQLIMNHEPITTYRLMRQNKTPTHIYKHIHTNEVSKLLTTFG